MFIIPKGDLCMRFSIDGAEWYKGLSFVMPAIPPTGKAEKGWAEGVLVEADEKKGTLTLTTTDIRQIGMKNVIKANIEKSGKALLRSNLCELFDYLQRDGDITIDYDSTTKKLGILSQAYNNANIPCLDANDFRVLGLDEDDTTAKKFSINLDVLKNIVDTVAPSADPRDIETGKSGVLLRCEKKLDEAIPGASVEESVGNRKMAVNYDEIPAGPSKLVAVAADGRKLSKLEIKGVLDDADASYFSCDLTAKRPFEKVPSFEMLVPAGLLQTAYKSIASTAQPKDTVDVSVFGGFVTLRCKESAAALRLLAGDLPNWRRVLAVDTIFSFVIGTEDLKLAARIASVSNLGRKDDPIVVYVKDSAMHIANAVLGNDKASREIRTVVQTQGTLPPDDYKQGFRCENVSHVAEYIKTPYVRLNFAGPLKAMTLQPCIVAKNDKENDKSIYVTDDDFIALLMPLRING